jgi:hypothetical protein
VVFDSLDSSEGNNDDTVEATLRFMEHRPPIQISEQRATGVAGAAPTSSTTTEPGLSPSILGGR